MTGAAVQLLATAGSDVAERSRPVNTLRAQTAGASSALVTDGLLL